jgi:NAD(P)-dependent dehydrogenase (short-subunit alcohol dehydrogenase family)
MGLPTKEALFLTGAGSGIGRAVAISLLAKGYEVFGSAISATEAAELRDALTGDIRPVEVDVRDEASVQAAAEQVADQLGDRPLRAVLNIAGIITNGPLVDLSAETFSQVLAVNLVGMHSVTRAFLPLLRDHPHARVINMSSASGSRTMPFTGAYSASKFGVEALSSAMRMEFAPLGVDVVVVAPGLINTPMASQIKQDLEKSPSLPVYRDALRRFLERTETSIENGIPMQRVVDAIVEAVQELTPAKRYELHNNFLRDVVLMRILPTAHREAIVRKTLGLVAGGGAR